VLLVYPTTHFVRLEIIVLQNHRTPWDALLVIIVAQNHLLQVHVQVDTIVWLMFQHLMVA